MVSALGMKSPPWLSVSVGNWQDTHPDQRVTDFDAVSISDTIKDGPQVSFTTAAWSPAGRLIRALETDVWVHINGVGFARCRVIDAPRTWGPDGTDVISVTAVGYRRRFYNLHLHQPLIWDAPGTDQCEIVWQMVNYAQTLPGGQLGITRGVIEPGTPRIRTEWTAPDPIGERLDQLSEVIGGPWWGIDFDLKLNSWKRSSFPTANVPILRGSTGVEMTQRESTELFANAVLGVGDNASTTLVERDAPNIATDPKGRWEAVHGWSTVTQQSTLIEHVEGALATDQSPLATWAATIDVARWLADAPYRVGDIVETVVPRSKDRSTAAVEQVTQITDLTIGYSVDGELEVQVGMQEVDQ